MPEKQNRHRTAHSSFRRRYSRFAVAAASSLLVVLLPDASNFGCHAGWIDPDTPEDARTTTPQLVIPYTRPPEKKHKKKSDDNDDDDSTHHRRRHHTEPPTDSPTEFPTFVPTDSPTPKPSYGEGDTAPPTKSEREYELVFSDEFNTPHRTFGDGEDPRWTALEKNDYTNDAQHYYSPSNAATDEDGNLVISTEAQDTDIDGFDDVNKKKTRVKKHFKSAMLQSWNKFCFTGGVLEAEMSLPGRGDIGGLWPAFWMLGNLARHTYVGSSEHVWPWSSGTCTEKSRTAQKVSACRGIQHFGMEAGRGRGAPEIDVFEVQAGTIKAGNGPYKEMPVGQPFLSASYQVAPGRLPRPGEGWWPGPGQWYDNLTSGNETSLNIVFYGSYNHFLDDTDPGKQDYWSDAISYNRQLENSHFGKFHRYRLEWDLPDDVGNEENNFTKTHGYIRWFVDDEFILEIDGIGLDKSGTGAEISSEPMYLLLNTAISTQWGFPSCPPGCPCSTYDCNGGYTENCGFSEGFCDSLKTKPAEYKINYVRVYQDKNDPKQKVGCSTPERPTRKFIEANKEKYMKQGDKQPLKNIERGGGSCDPTVSDEEALPQTCGGSTRGTCQQKKNTAICTCLEGWTGPHCMNTDGFDDVIWDPLDTISDLGFHAPSFVSKGLFVLGGVVVIFLLAPLILAKKGYRARGGYRPVADYERRVES